MLKFIRDVLTGIKARQKAEADARIWRAAAAAEARDHLLLQREARNLNRAIQRRSRTIKRLRAQIALDAPTNLPELAKSKEGRALYNHAYQMGRRKGRRDQVTGNTEPVDTPVLDDKAFSADAAGLSDTPVEPVPAAAVAAVERVRGTSAVDVAVPLSANDEVSLPPAEPVAVVRHLHSVPRSDDERPGS